jgi:hypothetical protein
MYENLDKLILEAISNGKRRFAYIFEVPGILSQCKTHAKRRGLENDLAWRVLDGRLQALKRAKKIIYRSSEWFRVVEAAKITF